MMKTTASINLQSKEDCQKILTITCSFHPVRGGIAQVVKTYEDEVFEDLQYISNSCDKGKLANLGLLLCSLLKTLYYFVFKPHIKIVHIHTASYLSFRRSAIWVYLAKCFGRKVILHIHGGEFHKYYMECEGFVKKVLRKVDSLICLSDEWKAFFIKKLALENLEVIPNVVEKPQLKSITKKDECLHLLYFGYLGYRKGAFDLLKVFKDNREQLQGRLLLHVGGNGEVEKFVQKIQEYELEDLVIYEGFVSGERKAELLSLCDLFVLPSYAEGLPISILEAMSYKKPILSTKVGGIPQIVHNGENGYLFTAGDVDALATLILQVLNEKEELTQMGQRSYEKVEPYRSPNVRAKLEDLYTRLLSSDK